MNQTMREIKFRQHYLGKFHYWGFVGKGIFVAPLDNTFKDKIKSEEFTGLKDKNGKEIYEGDILKDINNSRKLIQWRITTFVVGYNLADGSNNRWEVIGNIWENGDLLK